MSIIQIKKFRQEKQRQYMKRNRARLELFIRARIPHSSSHEILAWAEQTAIHSYPEMIWDYVEARDIMLEFIEQHLAQDIYTDLTHQYWFDSAYVTKDLIAEICLSYMILGASAAAL